MESSEFFETVRTMHEEARRRGLFFQELEDEHLEGRRLTLHGEEVLAFASCSYVGLERHPALVEAVHRYVDRYGTQFSASRGYVSLRAHHELEAALDEIFGGHALLATTTTMAHQIALPVLATEKDAVVMDHQVHHSVHMASTLAKAAGTQVEIVRHGRIEEAEALIERLARTKRSVWFACDGVYSMFGDLAPISVLRRLLAAAPNVYLYVDDAHGMSWAGRHGRGSFLHRMPLHERLVVATSLNKAFSAAGGCVVLPSEQLRDRVRLCAGPVVFSGPLQPPMLGAAIASARIHLSPEITRRQRALRARVDRCNQRALSLGLPLLAVNDSPIFFFRCGLPRVAFAVAERLLERGIYVTASVYPAVPMMTAGIRLSVTTEHSMEDIDRVLLELHTAIPWAMARENLSRQQLDAAFARSIPAEALRRDEPSSSMQTYLSLSYAEDSEATSCAAGDQDPVAVAASVEPKEDELRIQIARTIKEIDREAWDAVMAERSCSSWDALVAAEDAFVGHERPEHSWSFLYIVIRDEHERLVAATYFTTTVNKDDMLMRTEVSKAVEQQRRSDPYFLTSQVVCMGSNLSEGSHLYLDRTRAWRAALTQILRIALDEYEAKDAGILMLRDFRSDDAELRDFLLDSGFVQVPMLDTHLLPLTWTSHEQFMARLSSRRRRQLRKVLAMTPHYRRESWDAERLDEEGLDHLYRLYRNVADRKLRLNTFPLPRNIISAMARSPAWDVVTLHLSPDVAGTRNERPVAWYGAHVASGHYMPLVCGLDYTVVYSHGAYRQLLYQIVLRAQELGCRCIHFGMDANYEKERFRTTRVKMCAYVHARDDFVGARMREVIADVGLGT